MCFFDLSVLVREACHSFSLQYWIGWSLQSRNWTASWRASRCQSGLQGGLGWAGWRWGRRGLSQVAYTPDLPKGPVTRLGVPHSEMKASVLVKHILVTLIWHVECKDACKCFFLMNSLRVHKARNSF